MESEDLEKFRNWLVSRGRGEDTADGYAYDIAASLACRNITDRIVDKSLAPKTRRRIVASLRAWAAYTKDGDLLLTLKDIRLPPSKRKTVRRPLEREIWLELIEAIRANRRFPPAIRATLLIISVRGLRVGDVLRMTHHDVSKAVSSGRLIFEAKGGHLQDFTAKPMLEGLGLLLEQGRWSRVADLICPDAKFPKRAARKRVHRALRAIAKRIGVETAEIYPHRLRRTYAVQFLRALKGDPEALQKLIAQMGWSGPSTALTYTDFLSSESLDEVDEKMRR